MRNTLEHHRSLTSTQPSHPPGDGDPEEPLALVSNAYRSPEAGSDLILCRYENRMSKVQVIRSAESSCQLSHWHVERVVFPGQQLLFWAPRQARVNVYMGQPVGTLLADTVLCDRIQVRP